MIDQIIFFFLVIFRGIFAGEPNDIFLENNCLKEH